MMGSLDEPCCFSYDFIVVKGMRVVVKKKAYGGLVRYSIVVKEKK